MGLFSKPEVVVLKESSDARDYLQKLQELLPKARGEAAKKIEREIAIVNAGIYGEDNILFELKNSGMDLVVLHDLYLKTDSGLSAQIDFLVLSPKVFFVIECKNLFGSIEITNGGDFIRTFGKFKEGIYSPITQNERHLTVLKERRSEKNGFIMKAIKNAAFESQFKGIVVLANPKTVVNDRYAKKEIKEKVIRADQLIHYMKQANQDSKDLPSSLKELVSIGETYLNITCEERPDYLEKFEELVKEVGSPEEPVKPEPSKSREPEEAVGSPSDAPFCPRCGSPLVLRTAKKGDNVGNKFYGCSAFPKCRYIQNLNE